MFFATKNTTKNSFLVFLFVFFFLLFNKGHANSLEKINNVRQMALLPITGNASQEIKFEVFSALEEYFKNANWCYYRFNAEVAKLLEEHRDNLGEYLQKKEVLSVIGQKLQAGSLVRISLDRLPTTLEISFDILSGEEGETLFFSQKLSLPWEEKDRLKTEILRFPNQYKLEIPYIGLVSKVIGNSLTITAGQDFGVLKGKKIKLIRPIKKVSHPLLKSVVSFETTSLAMAEIVEARNNISVAKIFYTFEKNENAQILRNSVQVGDWAIMEATETGEYISSPQESDTFQTGHLGRAKVMPALATVSSTSNTASGVSKTLSGTSLGGELTGEFWITRHWIAEITFKTQMAKLTSEDKQLNNAWSYSKISLGGGYRYLPFGHFYGPQIDFLLNYSRSRFSFVQEASLSLNPYILSGLGVGFMANIPFRKVFRPFFKLEYLLFSSFAEENGAFGAVNSKSALEIAFGLFYRLNEKFLLVGEIQFYRALVEGKSSAKKWSFQSSQFKIGAAFDF